MKPTVETVLLAFKDMVLHPHSEEGVLALLAVADMYEEVLQDTFTANFLRSRQTMTVTTTSLSDLVVFAYRLMGVSADAENRMIRCWPDEYLNGGFQEQCDNLFNLSELCNWYHGKIAELPDTKSPGPVQDQG